MSTFLISLITMAVVLGIMILVHEFGHFAVAKLLGVRVEQFAIGFGRRLVGFRRGETEYRINALPLGGYVKMPGENPGEAKTGDPGEFTSHPRWHRFLIAIAGPAMNVLLAIVLLTGVYMANYSRPPYLDRPADIGSILENSAAARIGLQPGDRIVRVNDRQNPTWEQVMTRVLLSPGQPLDIAVQRNGQITSMKLTPDKVEGEQFDNAGMVPDEPVIVQQLDPALPAAKAGLQVDDKVIAVNGTPVRTMADVGHKVQESQGQAITMTVLRDGKQAEFSVTPAMVNVDGRSIYRIGFSTQIDKLPFGQAVQASLRSNRQNSLLIIELVEKLFRRQVSMKQIAGPIGIGVAAGKAVRQQGWTPIVELMALISLNLGVFNLLPIPILDGGMILLLLIEGLIRRDISMAVKERIYQAAFVFLLLIGVVVIYNDIMRQLPGVASRLP